jgi:hypothetical protein
MIVNSSQGGGSKDTWVLDDDLGDRPGEGWSTVLPARSLPDLRFESWTGQQQQQQQHRP